MNLLTNTVLLGNAAGVLVKLDRDPENTLTITANYPNGDTEDFVLDSNNWSTGRLVSFVPSLTASTVTFNQGGYPSGEWTVNVDTLDLVFGGPSYVRWGQEATIIVKLDERPENNLSITAHIPSVTGEYTETIILNDSNWNTGLPITFTPLNVSRGGLVTFNPGGYPAGEREIGLTFVALVINGDDEVIRGNTADIKVKMNRDPVIPMTINAYYQGSLLETFVINSFNYSSGVTVTFLPVLDGGPVTFNPAGYPTGQWEVATSDLGLVIDGNTSVVFGQSVTVNVRLTQKPHNTVSVSYRNGAGPVIDTFTLTNTNWDTGVNITHTPQTLSSDTLNFSASGTFSYVTGNHTIDVEPLSISLDGDQTIITGGPMEVYALLDKDPILPRVVTATYPDASTETFTYTSYNYVGPHKFTKEPALAGTTIFRMADYPTDPIASWVVTVLPLSLVIGGNTPTSWGNSITLNITLDKDPERQILVTATIPETSIPGQTIPAYTESLIFSPGNWDSGVDLVLTPGPTVGNPSGMTISFDAPGVLYQTQLVQVTFVQSNVSVLDANNGNPRTSFRYLNQTTVLVKLDSNPNRNINFTVSYVGDGSQEGQPPGTLVPTSQSVTLGGSNWDTGEEVTFVLGYGSSSIVVEGANGYPVAQTVNVSTSPCRFSLSHSTTRLYAGGGSYDATTLSSALALPDGDSPEAVPIMVSVYHNSADDPQVLIESYTFTSSDYNILRAPTVNLPLTESRYYPNTKYQYLTAKVPQYPFASPNYSFLVDSFLIGNPNTPVVTSVTLTEQNANTAFSYQIVATNMKGHRTPAGEVTRYDCSNLPNGLTMDNTTGVISGTLLFDSYGLPGGVYTMNVSATNFGGTGTGTVSIKVNPLLQYSRSDNGAETLYTMTYAGEMYIGYQSYGTYMVTNTETTRVRGVTYGIWEYHAPADQWEHGDPHVARVAIPYSVASDPYGRVILGQTMYIGDVRWGVNNVDGIWNSGSIKRSGATPASGQPPAHTRYDVTLAENGGMGTSLVRSMFDSPPAPA